MTDIEPNPQQLLQSAKTILLVDWPHAGVPRALLNAGLVVFGYSPDGYSMAALAGDPPTGQRGFPPRNENEKGYLVFRELDSAPAGVDIVNVYRPEEEHKAIIENHVLPLGAKVLWLQPPVTSAQTKSIALEKGLVFVEGVDVSEIA